MRVLLVILAAAVMAFAGCDLDLGGSGDYKVVFDVTNSVNPVASGVTYTKGSTAYSGLPVMTYSTVSNEYILIVAKNAITLDSTGRVPDGSSTDEYIYLVLSGVPSSTNLTLSADTTRSAVFYNNVAYTTTGTITAGEATFTIPQGGTLSSIANGTFKVALNDGNDFHGTFNVILVNVDSTGGTGV